jgi:hypothetical protein
MAQLGAWVIGALVAILVWCLIERKRRKAPRAENAVAPVIRPRAHKKSPSKKAPRRKTSARKKR